MHEYSLVSAMVDSVEKEARARSAVAVHRLGVRIGALSGVEPELFASAFTLVRQGLLENAELDIRRAEAAWACPACGKRDRAGERPALRGVRRAREARDRRRDPARADRDGGSLMCDTCGCGDPNLVSVEVHDKILSVNDATAAHNREHFVEGGVFAVNLMGSPGAGKTAVLEATARASGRGGPHRRRSPATSRPRSDADRLRAVGVPAAAITTGSACHLDAEMVHKALHHFPWRELDYLFVENVGNLVCPAVYDLGQAVNVVALSVTEGEDKPLKYPVMFRKADLVLLTKVDLLPHLDLDVAAIEEGLARVMPQPALIKLSARTGAGIEEWLSWLAARRGTLRPAVGHRHHDHSHA